MFISCHIWRHCNLIICYHKSSVKNNNQQKKQQQQQQAKITMHVCSSHLYYPSILIPTPINSSDKNLWLFLVFGWSICLCNFFLLLFTFFCYINATMVKYLWNIHHLHCNWTIFFGRRNTALSFVIYRVVITSYLGKRKALYHQIQP